MKLYPTNRGQHALRALRGFTVVELLVAAGITVILAAVMLSVVTHVLEGWNQSQGRLTTAGQARLVLDQVQRDLTGLVIRRDEGVWLAASVQDGTDISGLWMDGSHAKPSAASLDALAERQGLAFEDRRRLRNARFGKAGVWLRLIVSGSRLAHGQKGEDSEGTVRLRGPVAVAYQMLRRRPTASGSASFHYLLYRTETGPAETLEEGYNLDPGMAVPPAYIADKLGQPDAGNILADNVIDFGVWFYAREADGSLARLYPLDQAGGYVGFPDADGRIPAVADIMVRILTPEGAKQIAALESGHLSDASWWVIADRHSRSFTRRVEIPVSVL